ncbi:MAG: hypothetical protein ABIF77_01085 [bacterium]
MSRSNIRYCLPLALAICFLTLPSLAWNPSAADEHYGRMVINGQPSGGNVVTYFSQPYYDGPYIPKAHGYILQHAVRLLRQDGYDNWADVAQLQLSHLLSGATHADYYKGRILATLQLELLFGLHTEDLHSWDITCYAGCNHYYNYDDGTGLEMEVEAVAAAVLDLAILKFALTIGSLVGLDVDITPSLPGSFASAVDLCQHHFNQAVTTYNTGNLIYPGRSAQSSAYYELGWACHLLADQAVAQHQFNSFLGDHTDYEDFADDKGDPAEYPAYHPASAKPFNAYHHGQSSWPARQFARTLAGEVYHRPDNFDWAEDGGDTERDLSLQFVMPRAEAYTAGLLARFFNEVGIPAHAPPLTGVVKNEAGAPVPYAYLFHTSVGRTFQIEQDSGAGAGDAVDPTDQWRAWSVLRTDAHGRYRLLITPDTKYLLRPAMPGYSFAGRTSRNLEFGQMECPVVYWQERGKISGNSLDFYLRQLPVMVTGVLALEDPSEMILAEGLDPGSLVGSLPRPIDPGTSLQRSGSEISPTLARNIHEALLQVSADHSTFGVKGGNSGLPEGAVVTIRLSRLLSLTTQQLCLSQGDVTATIDRTRQLQAVHAANPAVSIAGGSVLTAQSLAAATALLPKVELASSGGRQLQHCTIGTLDDGQLGSNSLLGSGLVLVPDLGGAEIEVTVVSGVGYLSSPAEPLLLSTNSDGIALLGINAGSHAGRIRLQVAVKKSPDGVAIPRSAEIEFLVQPAPRGCDPATETAPTQFFMMQAIALEPAGPQVRWQPDSRVTVQVGPDGVLDRTLERVDDVPDEQIPDHPGERPRIAGRTEDFENRVLDGWELTPAAEVGEIDGRRALVFHGPGHGIWPLPPVTGFRLSYRFRAHDGVGEVVMSGSGEPPRQREYQLLFTPEEVEFSRRIGNDMEPLGYTRYALEPGQWYDVAASLAAGRIEVSINGEVIISTEDPRPLVGGAFAFGCLHGEGIAYDDISLSDIDLAHQR